jgi:hypothetical protein
MLLIFFSFCFVFFSLLIEDKFVDKLTADRGALSVRQVQDLTQDSIPCQLFEQASNRNLGSQTYY